MTKALSPGQRGFKHSADTKKKISIALSGRRLSPEHKKNLSAAKIKSGEAKRENNPAWKGGKHLNNGYVCILAEGDTRTGLSKTTKYRHEHTVIAEKALGRRLRKNEMVHHVNGKKDDNRNCNLLVCDHSFHKWLEARMCRLYQKEHFT